MVKKLLNGKHILIAEDNLTNQIVVAKMMDALGGTYDLAADGVEAIQMFDPEIYDLALLDIEMPRKSGLEVIRHIRNFPKVPNNFPIVALTAFVLPNHKVKIREAGATTIISKPIVDIIEFGTSLSKYFENSSNPSVEIKHGLNTNVLDDLKNSLGADITSDLIKNLDIDLEKIYGKLMEISKPVDKEVVSRNTHALLSLAGMAGDDGLVATTQNLNAECKNLSDEDILGAITDILKQIKSLQSYLADWNSGLMNE